MKVNAFFFVSWLYLGPWNLLYELISFSQKVEDYTTAWCWKSCMERLPKYGYIIGNLLKSLFTIFIETLENQWLPWTLQNSSFCHLRGIARNKKTLLNIRCWFPSRDCWYEEEQPIWWPSLPSADWQRRLPFMLPHPSSLIDRRVGPHKAARGGAMQKTSLLSNHQQGEGLPGPNGWLPVGGRGRLALLSLQK